MPVCDGCSPACQGIVHLPLSRGTAVCQQKRQETPYIVSNLMAQTVTTSTSSLKLPTHTRVDGVDTNRAGRDEGGRSLILSEITSVQSELLSYLSRSTLHGEGTWVWLHAGCLCFPCNQFLIALFVKSAPCLHRRSRVWNKLCRIKWDGLRMR